MHLSTASESTKLSKQEDEKLRDEEAEFRRQAYINMMQIKMLTVQEVNENVNLYFKQTAKQQPDWDEFDRILLQMSMLVMKNEEIKLADSIERLDEMITHFRRRARRREFPSIKYIVYV